MTNDKIKTLAGVELERLTAKYPNFYITSSEPIEPGGFFLYPYPAASIRFFGETAEIAITSALTALLPKEGK